MLSGIGIFIGQNVAATSGGVVTLATLNPADQANVTLSNGNLTAVASTVKGGVRATRSISAKAYWEMHIDNEADSIVGAIVDASASFTAASWFNTNSPHTMAWGDSYGNYNGTAISFADTGRTQGWAYDPGTKKAWIRDSTGWLNGDPVAGTGGMDISGMTGAVYPAFQGDVTDAGTFNFGATAYTFTPPTGYGNV